MSSEELTLKEYKYQLENLFLKIENTLLSMEVAKEKKQGFITIPERLEELYEKFEELVIMFRERYRNIRKSVAVQGVAEPYDKDASLIIDESSQYEYSRPNFSQGAQDLFEEFEQYHGFFARSEAMLEVFQLLKKLKGSDATTLIMGESGVGKELVAKSLHKLSGRGSIDEKGQKAGPYISKNCSAIPSELFESEVFGVKKGGHSKAEKDIKGYFLQADGGTLFLDEIGEMSLSLQPKLLRALETGKINRIGSEESESVDVRFLAATNQDLKEAIKMNNFREDLYYRLRTIEIKVPALRERREEIPHLAFSFFKKSFRKHCPDQEEKILSLITEKTFQSLCNLDWPGNVRELENFIERIVWLNKGHLHHLTTDIIYQLYGNQNLFIKNIINQSAEEHGLVRKAEYWQLLSKFIANDFAKKKTAKDSGVDRDTLRYKVNSALLQVGSHCEYQPAKMAKLLEDRGVLLPDQIEKFSTIVDESFNQVLDRFYGKIDKRSYETEEDEPLIEELIDERSDLARS